MISQAAISRIKSVDPDRYRAALLAGPEDREKLWLLYAFHYELAKVPEFVSEPMVGQIRYQWWRDAVDEIYSGKPVRAHEIATPLAIFLRDSDIPRLWIDQLIDARERDLDPTPFADMAAAQDYCRQTSGMLAQLSVKTLGVDPTDAVFEIGQAWGLTGLARSWRFYKDTMLSEIELGELIESAAASYTKARDGLKAIPHAAFPAVAYGTLVPKYIGKMKKPDFEPEETAVQISPLIKQWHLLTAVLRGRV